MAYKPNLHKKSEIGIRDVAGSGPCLADFLGGLNSKYVTFVEAAGLRVQDRPEPLGQGVRNCRTRNWTASVFRDTWSPPDFYFLQAGSSLCVRTVFLLRERECSIGSPIT